MNKDLVGIEINEGVATLTLNRPEAHNAFDDAMIARLSELLGDLAVRTDIVVVVLRGAGKSFSAGADLNWMKRAAGYSEAQNKVDAMALAEMLHKLDTLPKTTVACVQGAAMGGGLGLAACCDIVIAHDDAVFALSEVKLGLIPATIAPYVLRALGPRQSRRFFQTGEKFQGQQAFDLGLAHEIAHSYDEMEAKLRTILDVLRQNGPEAMAAAKRLCLDFAGRPVTPDLIDETAERIARVRAGGEAKEGLAAFVEKRPASWLK